MNIHRTTLKTMISVIDLTSALTPNIWKKTCVSYTDDNGVLYFVFSLLVCIHLHMYTYTVSSVYLGKAKPFKMAGGKTTALVCTARWVDC